MAIAPVSSKPVATPPPADPVEPAVADPKTDPSPKPNLQGVKPGEFAAKFKEGVTRATAAERAGKDPIAEYTPPPKPADPPPEPKPAEAAPVATPATPPATPPAEPKTPKLEYPKAKPAEAKPAEPEPKPEPDSPNFKRLREERDQLAKRAKEIEAKLAEAETKLTKAVDVTELEKIRLERDRLQEVVGRNYLVEDPRFQREFDEPMATATDRIKALAPDEYKTTFEALMKMPPGELRETKLAEVMEELPPHVAGRIATNYERFCDREAARNAEVTKWKDNLKQLKDYEKVKTLEAENAAAAQRLAFAERELVEAAANFPETFGLTDDPAHNETVKERVLAVKEMVRGTPKADFLARLAVFAGRAEHAQQMLAEQKEYIHRLETQIQQLQGSGPTIPGGKAPEPPKEESTADAAVSRYRKYAQEHRLTTP